MEASAEHRAETDEEGAEHRTHRAAQRLSRDARRREKPDTCANGAWGNLGGPNPLTAASHECARNRSEQSANHTTDHETTSPGGIANNRTEHPTEAGEQAGDYEKRDTMFHGKAGLAPLGASSVKAANRVGILACHVIMIQRSRLPVPSNGKERTERLVRGGFTAD